MFDTAFRTPYRPFFISTFLTAIGSWMHNVAAAITVYQLTGSAFVTGMVSAAQFGMILLLAPVAGRVADSVDKRLIIVVWQAVTAVAAGLLAVLVALDLQSPLAIILIALAMGCTDGIAKPASQAILPELVGPRRVDEAIALNSVCYNVGRALGPGLGGALVVAAASWLPFALNAALSAVAFWLVVRAHGPEWESRSGSVSAGGMALLRTRGIRVVLLSGVAVALAADPALTLAPQMAAEADQSSGFAGIIGSSFGIGSLLAFAGMSKVRKSLGLTSMGSIGLALIGIGVATAGLTAGDHVLVLASIGLGGAGFMTAAVALASLAQQRANPSELGRVMAAWGAAFLGMRPIASLLNGAIADAAGLVVACVVAAVPALVMSTRLGRPSGS
ncbi:MAG: MFS transporter [Actinophytocola sp.]|uniref:MFS transporter n=1 Tax=Actinophytocola sp. TaxID=1872138 RepID=UPI001321E927|nr:MFS transporter [Actinophytocola sp.]MPZ82495.1 MFS transporter [Actinophytocola sp.]